MSNDLTCVFKGEQDDSKCAFEKGRCLSHVVTETVTDWLWWESEKRIRVSKTLAFQGRTLPLLSR